MAYGSGNAMEDVVWVEGNSRIHAEPSPMSDTGLGRSGTLWVSCDKVGQRVGIPLFVVGTCCSKCSCGG